VWSIAGHPATLEAPEIAMESSATHLRLETVAASRLLGFAPRRLVLNAASRLGLTELRVKGLSWPCRLSVRYRPDAYLSPAARRFIELLKATAKERS
jgi:DNA-binding transcriptional LysR family regulator